MLEYIKTDNWWNLMISLHEVCHSSFTPIRSGSKEKLHQDCSIQNVTMSWTSKLKRTLQGFQRSFTCPQTVNGLGVTIFEPWLDLLKTEILGRLQRQPEKWSMGLFGWDSSPELNTKTLNNSPRFPLVTYTVWSEQRFQCYGILRIDETAETVWDRTAVGRYKILETKLFRNPGSSEYQSNR
jgi:hypothetical protein